MGRTSGSESRCETHNITYCVNQDRSNVSSWHYSAETISLKLGLLIGCSRLLPSAGLKSLHLADYSALPAERTGLGSDWKTGVRFPAQPGPGSPRQALSRPYDRPYRVRGVGLTVPGLKR